MLTSAGRKRSGRTVLEQLSAFAATGCAIFAAASFKTFRRRSQELEGQLKHEAEKRTAERAGRIAAEQKIRQQRLSQQPAAASPLEESEAQDAPSENTNECGPSRSDQTAVASTSQRQRQMDGLVAYPLAPIGYARSCFSQRNGTPRQPLLVPSARLRVQLINSRCPFEALDGLQGWSHVWVLYIFHENTDLVKSLDAGQQQAGGSKAKVRVPRLNGGTKGVLATRTPHRPCPIGLSVAQVMSVDPTKGVLVLGGADIVDGSPILDIKPYVPFADSVPTATAPSFVQAENPDGEPLHISAVHILEPARQDIQRAWAAVKHSLYASADDFMELVHQVLSRDIRSVHQRRDVGRDGALAEGAARRQGRFHVLLEGIDVCYDVDGSGAVWVRGAGH